MYIRSGYDPGRGHKKNGNRARAQRKPSARFAIAEPAELLISTLEGCVRQLDPHESGLRDIEKRIGKTERKVGATFKDKEKGACPASSTTEL